MNFWSGLIELLLSESGTISGNKGILLGIFATGSALMGMIIVFFDWIIFRASGSNVLKLTHRGLNTLWFLFLWGAGAGIGGFLGAATEILQINRAACITVGAAWPLILPRLIASASAASGKDVQSITEEE